MSMHLPVLSTCTTCRAHGLLSSVGQYVTCAYSLLVGTPRCKQDLGVGLHSCSRRRGTNQHRSLNLRLPPSAYVFHIQDVFPNTYIIHILHCTRLRASPPLCQSLSIWVCNGMYGQPSPRKIGNHRQGSTNRHTRHPSTDAVVKVGPVHYEPCDFVVRARSGSCIPGEGSICAVRTTLAPLGDPHSAVTASESVLAYGTTDRPRPRDPVLEGVVARCERPELLLLWRRVGVCGEEGRNGPDSSSTLSRSSCSGDDVRSLSDADACLACERVRLALAV